VATYGEESWILNKDVVKRLVAFKRKVFRGMFGGIKLNQNSRKRYNEELMQKFRVLNILHLSA